MSFQGDRGERGPEGFRGPKGDLVSERSLLLWVLPLKNLAWGVGEDTWTSPATGHRERPFLRGGWGEPLGRWGPGLPGSLPLFAQQLLEATVI